MLTKYEWVNKDQSDDEDNEEIKKDRAKVGLSKIILSTNGRPAFITTDQSQLAHAHTWLFRNCSCQQITP